QEVGLGTKPAVESEKGVELTGEGQQPEEEQQSRQDAYPVESDRIDGGEPEPHPGPNRARKGLLAWLRSDQVRGDGGGSRRCRARGNVSRRRSLFHLENSPKLLITTGKSPGRGSGPNSTPGGVASSQSLTISASPAPSFL